MTTSVQSFLKHQQSQKCFCCTDRIAPDSDDKKKEEEKKERRKIPCEARDHFSAGCHEQ